MSSALKHKQRSSRSYQTNRQVMDSVAAHSDKKNAMKSMMKKQRVGIVDMIKQRFMFGKKGDK